MHHIKYDWLYIIFVHESGVDREGRTLDGFLVNQVDNLQKCTFSHKIKVIIVQNYPAEVRTLTQKEKRVMGEMNREFLYFYETIVFESVNQNDKIGFKKIHRTNYWQNAFNFIFTTYQAKKYTLHTQSHCTGHEINSTDYGFALNSYGVQLMSYRNELSSYNNQFYKKALKRLIHQRKNKYYLFAGLPKYNTKKVKLFALRKKHLKYWNVYNSTNGLLFYDFTTYLKSTKIKFEYVFLNNCNILLYENIYLLNDVAYFVFGSPGLIDGEFVNAEIIYNNLTISTEPAEKAIVNIFYEFMSIVNRNDPSRIKNRHYSVIKLESLFSLTEKLRFILFEINKIMQKSKKDFLLLKTYIESQKGKGFKIISDETGSKPYYDILEFVKIFIDYDQALFKSLVLDFENILLKKVILHNEAEDGENHYLSICFPNDEQMFTKTIYLRSFFKQPKNSFAKYIGYDKFISNYFPI
ncbi:MAG: hypothetical protein ABIO79_05465 [Ferruginibacter sp.]